MFHKFFILSFLFLILFAMQIGATPFTDNGDGTVKDQATNLVWQKCSLGLSGTSCGSGSAITATWVSAVASCNGLSLASKTWRLPNINEFRTIIDYAKSNSPFIDVTTFPTTFAFGYWSSTPFFYIYFLDGTTRFTTNTTANLNVRCVSGP